MCDLPSPHIHSSELGPMDRRNILGKTHSASSTRHCKRSNPYMDLNNLYYQHRAYKSRCTSVLQHTNCLLNNEMDSTRNNQSKMAKIPSYRSHWHTSKCTWVLRRSDRICHCILR